MAGWMVFCCSSGITYTHALPVKKRERTRWAPVRESPSGGVMADKLYLPAGARNTQEKDRSGLYVGAVVVVENTGLGEQMDDGGEMPVNGIVSRVYPDQTMAQDRYANFVEWNGARPFIDVVVVRDAGSDLGELSIISKIPWAEDVRNLNKITTAPTRAGIQYRVVGSLQSIL